jgi:hypothetical protein
MKVLIIEDDSIQARRLGEHIQRHFADVTVDRIETELRFLKLLPGIGEAEYKVALIDMMLRWTDPSPTMEQPPPEVLKEGFFVGGLRCRKALAVKHIPSIIFTVHDRDSFAQLKEPDVEFVQKTPDFEPLFEKLSLYLSAVAP